MAKILIVDDNPDTLFTLKVVIEKMTSHEVLLADSGDQCLALAHEHNPAVILLDVHMPLQDGFTVCERLKADESTKHIPVLFLTAAHKDVSSKVLGFEIGAEDYLLKPIDNRELIARLEAALRKRQAEDEMRATMAELERLATTDPLTGAINRRHFEERLQAECQRAERYKRTLSLLLIDVDHFKEVNDTYGHPMGDCVLREVANVLRASVRSTDVVARCGGDEFAVILLEAEKEDGDGARAAAERIRRSVEASPVFTIGQNNPVRVTVSIGVASYPEDAVFPAHLIEAADRALYHAKRNGRNRVVCAASPMVFIEQLEETPPEIDEAPPSGESGEG
ncbi:MAG: diguanylate cyclase [Abditibacteriales bacterium]|nr:diguanylate cyclase [Abditibacteriales bacterium]MDW8367970.1 diguanylate cyclase [Abditibacteriales bacterium]